MALWARRLPPLGVERPPKPTQVESPGQPRQFLWRLARALQRFGVPAHRLEQALDVVAERLGVEGEFVVTPTFIIGTVDGAATVTRVHNEGTDLKRLIGLHQLLRDLITGLLTVEEAENRLDAIEADRPHPVAWKEIVGYSLVAAAGAVLLDGGPWEVLLSALLGLVHGVLLFTARRAPTLELLLPVLAGFLAAAASTLALALVPLQPLIPTIALLIPLLPGFTVTLAASELAHRHLVSGGARMAGALMTLAQLGFGVVIGTQLVLEWTALGETAVRTPLPLPGWVVILALVASVLLFAARNRARPSDLGFVLAAATVSLAAGRASSVWIGPELGACLTAWLITTLGYAASRRWDIPSVVFLLPGLLLLVPGVMGFKSLSSMLQSDVVMGLEHGVAMARIALALVMGLLIANLTSRPREIF